MSKRAWSADEDAYLEGLMRKCAEALEEGKEKRRNKSVINPTWIANEWKREPRRNSNAVKQRCQTNPRLVELRKQLNGMAPDAPTRRAKRVDHKSKDDKVADGKDEMQALLQEGSAKLVDLEKLKERLQGLAAQKGRMPPNKTIINAKLRGIVTLAEQQVFREVFFGASGTKKLSEDDRMLLEKPRSLLARKLELTLGKQGAGNAMKVVDMQDLPKVYEDCWEWLNKNLGSADSSARSASQMTSTTDGKRIMFIQDDCKKWQEALGSNAPPLYITLSRMGGQEWLLQLKEFEGYTQREANRKHRQWKDHDKLRQLLSVVNSALGLPANVRPANKLIADGVKMLKARGQTHEDGLKLSRLLDSLNNLESGGEKLTPQGQAKLLQLTYMDGLMTEEELHTKVNEILPQFEDFVKYKRWPTTKWAQQHCLALLETARVLRSKAPQKPMTPGAAWTWVYEMWYKDEGYEFPRSETEWVWLKIEEELLKFVQSEHWGRRNNKGEWIMPQRKDLEAAEAAGLIPARLRCAITARRIIDVAQKAGLAHEGHRIISRDALRQLLAHLACCVDLTSQAEKLLALEMAGFLRTNNARMQELMSRFLRNKVSREELHTLANKSDAELDAALQRTVSPGATEVTFSSEEEDIDIAQVVELNVSDANALLAACSSSAVEPGQGSGATAGAKPTSATQPNLKGSAKEKQREQGRNAQLQATGSNAPPPPRPSSDLLGSVAASLAIMQNSRDTMDMSHDEAVAFIIVSMSRRMLREVAHAEDLKLRLAGGEQLGMPAAEVETLLASYSTAGLHAALASHASAGNEFCAEVVRLFTAQREEAERWCVPDEFKATDKKTGKLLVPSLMQRLVVGLMLSKPAPAQGACGVGASVAPEAPVAVTRPVVVNAEDTGVIDSTADSDDETPAQAAGSAARVQPAQCSLPGTDQVTEGQADVPRLKGWKQRVDAQFGMKALLNYSACGTGKTISALLAAWLLGGDVLIICPTGVIQQWSDEVERCFPGQYVVVTSRDEKFFSPATWFREPGSTARRCFIVAVQLLERDQTAKELTKSVTTCLKDSLGLLVLDELHKVKFRGLSGEAASEAGKKRGSDGTPVHDGQLGEQAKRKRSTRSANAERLIGACRNTPGLADRLKVLGLTGTPMINSVEEAANLLDVLLCGSQPGLTKTIERIKKKRHFRQCLLVHVALTMHGVRFERADSCRIKDADPEKVLCGAELDKALQAVPGSAARASRISMAQVLMLEKVMTAARVKVIKRWLRELRPGEQAVIYTDFVGDSHAKKTASSKQAGRNSAKAARSGDAGATATEEEDTWEAEQSILSMLQDAVKEAGCKAVLYTGRTPSEERKAVLKQFTSGTANVLIGSRSITTAIDGLQVCSLLILNGLPFTDADYEQLVARLVRVGQEAKEVEVRIPLAIHDTMRNANTGKPWDDQTALERIKAKRLVTKAAVHGDFPVDVKLLEQFKQEALFRNLTLWAERVQAGEGTMDCELPASASTQAGRREMIDAMSDSDDESATASTSTSTDCQTSSAETSSAEEAEEGERPDDDDDGEPSHVEQDPQFGDREEARSQEREADLGNRGVEATAASAGTRPTAAAAAHAGPREDRTMAGQGHSKRKAAADADDAARQQEQKRQRQAAKEKRYAQQAEELQLEHWSDGLADALDLACSVVIELRRQSRHGGVTGMDIPEVTRERVWDEGTRCLDSTQKETLCGWMEQIDQLRHLAPRPLSADSDNRLAAKKREMLLDADVTRRMVLAGLKPLQP